MVSLGLGLVRVAFSPCKLARGRAGGRGSEHVPAELLLKCHVRPAGFCNVAGSGDLWAFFFFCSVYGFAISSPRGFFSPCLQEVGSAGCLRDPFPTELLR